MQSLQQAENSCGLAALAHVLSALDVGWWTEAQLQRDLAPRYPASGGYPPAAGYSLADLQWLATRYGLSSQALKLPAQALVDMTLPVILWIGGQSASHYVVLKQLTGQQALLFDPARGELAIPIDRLISQWVNAQHTGVLLQFESRAS